MKRLGLVVAMVALVVGLVAPVAGATVDPDYGWDYRALSLGDRGLIPITGQFGGDDATDVLWYHPGSGVDTLWLGRTGQRGASTFVRKTLAIGGTFTPLAGDFAGDGHTDIFWYGAGSAPDYLWTSNGDGTFTSTAMAVSGHFKPSVLPDFAADHKDDILWYDGSSAPDYLWHFADDGSGAVTSIREQLNRTFRIAVGAFNDDTTSDVLLYSPGSGGDLVWFFHPDGSHTAGAVPNLAATTYQPVTLYQQVVDRVLLWSSGPGADRALHPDGSGYFSTAIDLRQLGWHGTAYPSIDGAIIVVPDHVEIYFSDTGNTTPDFYDFAPPSRDFGAGTVPVQGDFDGDGYDDVIWYGPGAAKDGLWYTQPRSTKARTRRHGDREVGVVAPVGGA